MEVLSRICMMTLLDNELNNELPITSTSTLFESLFLEVWQKSFAKQKYIIGNVYRLPSYNLMM